MQLELTTDRQLVYFYGEVHEESKRCRALTLEQIRLFGFDDTTYLQQEIPSGLARQFTTAVSLAKLQVAENRYNRLSWNISRRCTYTVLQNSPIDHLLGLWQCVLCGNTAGLVVRCPISTCAVRVHPICAQLKKWEICQVEVRPSASTADCSSDPSNFCPLVIICSYHASTRK